MRGGPRQTQGFTKPPWVIGVRALALWPVGNRPHRHPTPRGCWSGRPGWCSRPRTVPRRPSASCPLRPRGQQPYWWSAPACCGAWRVAMRTSWPLPWPVRWAAWPRISLETHRSRTPAASGLPRSAHRLPLSVLQDLVHRLTDCRIRSELGPRNETPIGRRNHRLGVQANGQYVRDRCHPIATACPVRAASKIWLSGRCRRGP